MWLNNTELNSPSFSTGFACENSWLWWSLSRVYASTDARVDKDNAKVGLFIAAAMGTFTLMAAVYCIYNKFYTKHQYLHTQLNDDSGKLIFIRLLLS